MELLQVSKELRLLCKYLGLLGLFGLVALDQSIHVRAVSLGDRRLDKIYASELGGALCILADGLLLLCMKLVTQY